MKVFVLSLLVSINVFANDQMPQVWFDGAGAPIFAKLDLRSTSRNLTTINSLLVNVKSANVTFTEKTLNLVITRGPVPCPPNTKCVKVMPRPVEVNLEVVKVEYSQCGVKYTAVTPANVKAKYSEKVVVQDNSRSKCAHTLEYPGYVGSVSYEVTGVSSLTKKVDTGAMLFLVRNFVRAVN